MDRFTVPAAAGTAAHEPLGDMIDAVARTARLTNDQASAAVTAALTFLAGRLPSPLFGELQSHLQAHLPR